MAKQSPPKECRSSEGLKPEQVGSTEDSSGEKGAQKPKHDIEELIKLNEVEEQTHEDLLDDESPVFDRAEDNILEQNIHQDQSKPQN